MPTVNGTCPLSGNPVKETALTHCKGESVGVGVGFCNPHRRDDFDTAIRIFDALIACG
ncbi:hypothetical protein FHS96_004257 [Sphingomonas zeicaulis]|uniref:glutathione S-transferase n=1 Tax=Sphingomonas zeicaulis TaxID=1632740 RepID=UPI003D1D94A8